nr:hypothetical protein PJ912_06350 [Pectobacterium colocasium]WED69464.1 hypothetical protein PJ912_06390 [Pectobacterium colocasium]
MWHYAKAAERGPRVTHIMSAPGRLRARCGLLQHRRAVGRRGSAAQNSAAHRASPSAANISVLPWLARCGRPPWRSWLRRQPSANINVNRTGVVGLTASAERLYLAPAPTPLHWLCPARSRRLLARSRARHLRPVRPPPGASLLDLLSCGPRQPAPGRRFTVPQQAAERLAPR